MKHRIVILSAFLSPFRSGAEACAEEVPLRLADQWDFTIITGRYDRRLPRNDRLRSSDPALAGIAIPVLRIGIGHPIDKWLYPFLAPFAARKLQPDIVHGILETFAGLALLFCRYVCPSARRILTLQTTNRSFLKGPIIRSAHRVTAISGALQDIASHHGRTDVVVIPNGIHTAAIRSACGRHTKVPGRIVFVGRLEKMKGVDALLKGFHELRMMNYELGISRRPSLHIVGDGSQRRALEGLARELGIADRVRLLGKLDGGALFQEYAEAEMFCGLSRSEALGNVFLEAQAAGCAVVATKVGGIPEIVEDGVTGVLINADDAAQAAEAIVELLGDRDRMRRLTTKAQERAGKYDWGRVAELYDSLYAKFDIKSN